MTGDPVAAPPPWLVVIDMQEIFARPDSDWATARFAAILPTVGRLVRSFAPRVVFTRFVAPETPTGAWVPYYEQWPFALVPDDDPLYALVPELATTEAAVVTRPSFGKWDGELAGLLGGAEMVLAGVSTDCCVLSTALAAADAGTSVRVVADACAGASDADHQRALDAMALYAPLVTIRSAAEVLRALNR